ncbi:MAG: hypothetical protein IPH15_05320 [Comamonadaceae bacterium]|nr:hypothetical protein [Comamonadaceae bacterium]
MNRPDALHPPVAPTAISRPWLARLHPGLFGMVLGILGLSGAWQRLGHLDVRGAADVSAVLLIVGVVLLVVLLVLWGVKALRFPAVVRQEWSHPVQGALLALLPVSTLMAVALLVPRHPELTGVAFPVAMLALAFQGTMAWHVVAALSTGQTPPELVTPALYLPTVPGGFVGAMALDALGWHGWATLLVGMGLGAWALLEMRILNRLFAGPLPPGVAAYIGHRDVTGGGGRTGDGDPLAKPAGRRADGDAGRGQRPGAGGADTLALLGGGAVQRRFLVVFISARGPVGRRSGSSGPWRLARGGGDDRSGYGVRCGDFSGTQDCGVDRARKIVATGVIDDATLMIAHESRSALGKGRNCLFSGGTGAGTVILRLPAETGRACAAPGLWHPPKG